MTYESVRRIVWDYDSGVLGAHVAERHAKCRLCHLKWMIQEMRGWGPERLDKMFRWLGFIQGVLYSEGVFTIAELKGHSRLGKVFRTCQVVDK